MQACLVAASAGQRAGRLEAHFGNTEEGPDKPITVTVDTAMALPGIASRGSTGLPRGSADLKSRHGSSIAGSCTA